VSWTLLLAAAASALLLLAGCESTQSKSARLAKQASGLKQQQGLRIVKLSKTVKVEQTAVVKDANGTAAVVTLHNRSRRSLARVPVAIDVRGKSGGSVFRNDDPGLEPGLTGVSLLRPGQRLTWVNDQVLATGTAQRVKATVGVERAKPPARLPRIELTPPRLERDPTSGTLAVGTIANRSGVEQRNLVIYAVARRAGRIVAAGRGAVERLKPKSSLSYQVFFIGNPNGARIALTAPPTSLR
jgi:outer membrane murein-binding lipoprotein Lpp